jgi:hypothetical protein
LRAANIDRKGSRLGLLSEIGATKEISALGPRFKRYVQDERLKISESGAFLPVPAKVLFNELRFSARRGDRSKNHK